jgi:hypothetical protein
LRHWKVVKHAPQGISGCHIMKWGASELCHYYTNFKRVALNLIIISIGIIRIGYCKNLLVSSQYMHQMMGWYHHICQDLITTVAGSDERLESSH